MKYRAKLREIEAIKWTGENLTEILQFAHVPRFNILGEALVIETLEGSIMANVGDYFSRGLHGGYYPCKPDVFRAKYEPCE